MYLRECNNRSSSSNNSNSRLKCLVRRLTSWAIPLACLFLTPIHMWISSKLPVIMAILLTLLQVRQTPFFIVNCIAHHLVIVDVNKYNRGTESDMLPVSSQAAGAVQTATQAHNQPYAMNTYPPGYGFYFAGVNFAHQGLYGAAQQHPALYPVQAQTTASAGSAFAKANTAANYGSHSYNSGYDSLGGVAQTQDYVNKSYPQQLQQHKQMSATNSGDLSGNSQQSMYGKNHTQINKVSRVSRLSPALLTNGRFYSLQGYEKQGFQQSAQFNLSNTAPNANLSSYGAPYLLPQQAMHHTLASSEQTQQAGVGNQRSLSQTHKGSSSNNQTYGKSNYWN